MPFNPKKNKRMTIDIPRADHRRLIKIARDIEKDFTASKLVKKLIANFLLTADK